MSGAVAIRLIVKMLGNVHIPAFSWFAGTLALFLSPLLPTFNRIADDDMIRTPIGSFGLICELASLLSLPSRPNPASPAENPQILGNIIPINHTVLFPVLYIRLTTSSSRTKVFFCHLYTDIFATKAKRHFFSAFFLFAQQLITEMCRDEVKKPV